MILIFVIGWLTTQVASKDPDNSLCKQKPTSDVVGIPLPALPNQFHALFEANILQKGYTVYQEEYYDYPGNRGVIITTRNGQSMKSITDFTTYSVHQIDIGTGKCVVQDLRQMKSTLFNFTSTATGGHVKGLADIFKFSSKFNESYIGTTQIRGIPAHHWTTCLHVESLRATFNMDYYFSVKTYDLEGSQKEIPLRAAIKGIASNVDQNNVILNGTHNFNHVYEFVKFEPGPIKDPSVFQIPPSIICTGSQDKKPVPKMADQVSFGMEKMSRTPDTKLEDPMYIQVDYDFTSQIARLDLSKVPSNGLRKVYGNDSISLIQDFNLGVQYVIDSLYGNCSVTELTASFNDLTPRPSYLLPPEMRHPIALLDVNYSSMLYQGKKLYRDLNVESWGKVDDVTNFKHEIYFLLEKKDGPRSRESNPLLEPVPVGVYVSVNDAHRRQDGLKLKVESFTNIYNYQPNRIDPSRFDIRECYNSDSSFKQLHVAIKSDNPAAILSQKSLYLNHLHQFLSKTAKVSLTRISDLYITKGLIDQTISVYFILLNKSPMPAGRWSNVDKTPSLEEAYNNLQNAVTDGTLFTVDKKNFLVSSLYTQKSVQSDKKSEQGYSAGSMAGLGIGMFLTGSLCGLAGLYLVQKKRDTSVPYELQ
ncbi:uncharacterized protein LOC127721451 isoform X1 [Mytilus californianus]|uniref:uncharacterized protein LOC127721451 isoform X1 n=2 Tax=Mytilus californianus TaxID=6549 RepID=UPI002245EDC5|nr:uncharacterized protein LOC127721451 isoform X1 [Mytilus californianus]